MRIRIYKSILAGVLWVIVGTVPAWPQTTAIAPLISTGVGAAMSLGSMATSLAAQQRAAAMQQQFEAQQQAQQRAAQLQQVEQQGAAAAYEPRRKFVSNFALRKCPTGYHHATVLFSDGSKHRMCVEDEQ